LTALNDVLIKWRLHFGIRTRDEVCTYMVHAHDFCVQAEAGRIDLEGFDFDAGFDRQILQKILPRIAGTREELQYGPQGNLFDQLSELLAEWQAPLSIAKLDRMSTHELANFWDA